MSARNCFYGMTLNHTYLLNRHVSTAGDINSLAVRGFLSVIITYSARWFANITDDNYYAVLEEHAVYAAEGHCTSCDILGLDMSMREVTEQIIGYGAVDEAVIGSVIINGFNLLSRYVTDKD